MKPSPGKIEISQKFDQKREEREREKRAHSCFDSALLFFFSPWDPIDSTGD